MATAPAPATPRRTAATHASTSRGSRRSEEPAPFPVTTLAGQPQLRSTRGAPPSSRGSRASFEEFGVGAHELRAEEVRGAGVRVDELAGVVAFEGDAAEQAFGLGALRQDAGNARELAARLVEAAGAQSERAAKAVVAQALHGGEEERWATAGRATASEKSGVVAPGSSRRRTTSTPRTRTRRARDAKHAVDAIARDGVCQEAAEPKT